MLCVRLFALFQIVPPLIIQTVSNQTALEKSDAKLVCNASGAGVLAYSWRRLDTILGTSAAVGTNSSVMTIHGVQLSDAGTYQCTVMDAAGQSAISNRATLQVSSEKPSLDAASPAVGIIAGSVTGAALMVVVVVSFYFA